MADYGMKLTDAGLAAVADAVLNGTQVVISKVVWGDANGVAYDPDGSETALVNERHESNVTGVAINAENSNVIEVTGQIVTAVSGFTLLEVGLEDDAGNLIAIGRHPPQEIPADGAPWSQQYTPTFMIAVQNGGSLTIDVNVVQDYATEEWVVANFAPLGTYVESVNAGTGITVTGDPQNPIVAIDVTWADNRYWRRSETPTPGAHSHANATQSVAGFMSASDKTKLDGLGNPLFDHPGLFEKVAEFIVDTPINAIDLLNLSGAYRYMVIAQFLRSDAVVSDQDAQRIYLRERNGATIYSGASDYANNSGGTGSTFVLSDPSWNGGQLNTYPYGGLNLNSGYEHDSLHFILDRLNSGSYKTQIYPNRYGDDAGTGPRFNFFDKIMMRTPTTIQHVNDPYRNEDMANVARACDGIRIFCASGENFTSGHFFVYAVHDRG